MARAAIQRHGISVRFACVCMGISDNCYYYQNKLSDENAVIADWLLRLTSKTNPPPLNIIKHKRNNR